MQRQNLALLLLKKTAAQALQFVSIVIVKKSIIQKPEIILKPWYYHPIYLLVAGLLLIKSFRIRSRIFLPFIESRIYGKKRYKGTIF